MPDLHTGCTAENLNHTHIREVQSNVPVCYVCVCVCVSRTFRQEISDIQLQRGNDFVEHLELFPKARHLQDKTGWYLRKEKKKVTRKNHRMELIF